MTRGQAATRLLVLAGVCGLLIVLSALLGPQGVRWPAGDAPGVAVLRELRLTRVLKAALAGAGLSLSGVLLQALFRNPLATPYTLGIASGASLGAAAAFLAGLGGTWLWMPKLSVCALLGAFAALGAVFLMSRLRAGRDMTLLLLAGVCVSYMCSAGVMLLTFLANRFVTNDIVIWMMGSLAIHRPAANVEMAIVLAAAATYACWSHRTLDLLTMGEDLATSRGVNVGRTVWTSFLLVGVLTATIAANCGPIAFVGLMVPHMARRLLGVHTLQLVLGSALLGAAFLAVCDGIVRLFVYAPPVGVGTNILGAAFFFYLLAAHDTPSAADA